jgi:hypothetical protein
MGVEDEALGGGSMENERMKNHTSMAFVYGK